MPILMVVQPPISRTAAMLAHKGMILVNSAGNDGMGTWKKINVPADAPDILTVGAVSPDGINAPSPQSAQLLTEGPSLT